MARASLGRRLRRVAGKLPHRVPVTVLLRGGPMDGWVVPPHAPALRPNWYTSWPASVATGRAPGRYVREDAGEATWQPF